MSSRTHLYLQQFTQAYKAATCAPAPTGNAKVIAKWPTKQKRTISAVSYRVKGVSYRVW